MFKTVLNFDHLKFGFVSCFDIRISNLKEARFYYRHSNIDSNPNRRIKGPGNDLKTY